RVSTDNGLTALAVDSRSDATLLSLVRYPNGLALLPAGLRTPVQRIFGFAPDFINPRSAQVALSLEQRLAAGVQASLGYVHSDTRHLQRRSDRTLFPPTIDATGTPIYPTTRPNPSIGILSINESTAKARYDAGVVTLSAQRHRVRFQATYTLALNKD